MIIKSDNALAFATACDEVGFTFENKDRLVGTLLLANGHSAPLPLSLSNHDGQLHLNAHLPHKIPGKAAFCLYKELALDDDCFGIWVDPSDGECLFTYSLEDETAEELEHLIGKINDSVCGVWEILDKVEELADAQSDEDRGAYDPTDMLLASFAN